VLTSQGRSSSSVMRDRRVVGSGPLVA
jgi:hypothetical protein